MVSTECICQSDNELEAFLASLVPDENEMAITGLFGGDDALSLDLTVLIEDFPAPFEPARKKRRRVNRLKCNVEELRKTAEKLETELQLLKQQRQKRSSSQRLHGMTNDELVPPSGSRSRAWRGIAMRQYKRLRDSEMENTRLHLLLNEHVKIGRSLERLIQRGNSKALNLTPPSPLHRLLDTESAFLIQTRRDLEQCLQEMYCMVHVAMADPSFNTTEAEFHDLAVGTDGIYAHGMRLVPSARTTITRMIWDLLSDRRVTAPPRQYHSACEHDALSEIVSKCFVLNWDHLGQMTTYLGTFVGHRHREAGRDTIVYSANFANTADGLSSDCPSLRLYGWGQITSVAKLSTKVLFKSVARVNSTPIGCELHERLSQLGHAILLGHHERRQRAIDEALLSFHDTSA